MKPADARLLSLHDGVIRVGPGTLHIDITNACNTDCVTCWDHSPLLAEARPARWKRQRADAARICALLDDVASLGGLQAVIVSGMGEPFTHPAVYDILADIKRRGLHLTVITNLVAADPARVAALGVDALLVGVHGASEQSYLAFHPSFHADHWRALHQALAQLRGRVDCKHVQVICRTNAHELVAMVEQAVDTGASQINFKLASLYGGTEAARVDEEQRARMRAVDVDAARARAERAKLPHNLDVFARQLAAGGEVTAPIEEIGCFIGTSYARVTVGGTVLFCCNTEVEVGHLDDAPFSALWRGPRWQAWRAQMRAGDFLPSCRFCGKLNQNEKLSARFRARFGDEAWNAARGAARPLTAAPTAVARARGAALRVLP